jgi:hypothetical protein
MADIFDRINGTVVTPELLLEVLEMHIAPDYHVDGHDPECGLLLSQEVSFCAS